MAEMKSISVETIPLRPDYGDKGSPIKLVANLYEVSLTKPKVEVFLYTLVIDTALDFRDAKKVLPKLLDDHKQDFQVRFAHDGVKMLYCVSPLKYSEKVYKLELARGSSTSVTVKAVGSVLLSDLVDFANKKLAISPREAHQALEVILTHHARVTLTSAGKGYFDGKSVVDISNGAQIWFGYRQSVKVCEGRIMLNVDIANSVFRSPIPMVEWLEHTARRSIRDISCLRGRDLAELVSSASRKIKGVKVRVQYADKKMDKKVNSLMKPDFVVKDLGITVPEYFKKTYNISLKHPDLPLVHIGPVKRTILIPIEFCTILAGQRINKLTPQMTADVIKEAAKRPKQRFDFIAKGTRIMRENDRNSLVKEFGLKVSDRFSNVQGRVLSPPKVMFDQKEAAVVPRQGEFKSSFKFFLPASVEEWGVLSFELRKFLSPQDIGQFCADLIRVAARRGINFSDHKPPIEYGDCRSLDGVATGIDAILKRVKNPQIIFIFLSPKASTDVYGEIKRVCETERGILTQCMQVKNVMNLKRRAMYLDNLLLKDNIKLGGVNFVLQRAIGETDRYVFLKTPAIVFGADVTHSRDLPSIASVVASQDAYCGRYTAEIDAQGNREEIIVNLKSMVRSLLLSFYKTTQKKPEKILFYRDGVSEGQFAQVLAHEVTAIREACLSLEEAYLPPITFIVVQKRHHIRLFTENEKDADRSGNIPAGTIVDKSITHPTQFDFYLCSHAGLQGTSKPTHYHVLFDENKFSANNLQEFTNHLCYSYARCTKAVSLVPPVYYAHLSAYRARFHAPGNVYSDEASSTLDFQLPSVTKNLQKSMYFV